jgi:hypothetical protein
MRKGIHRGYKDDPESARRAWVAEAPGEAGEWVSKSDDIAQGYSPDFESLPVKVVVRAGSAAISDDEVRAIRGPGHSEQKKST